MMAALRREDCEAAITKYLRSSDFVLEDYDVKPFNQTTAGFMGRHLKLTANVVFGGEPKQISLFAKLIPTEEKLRAVVMKAFLKEASFYSRLVPKFNSCLPPGETVPVPECFFIRWPQSEDPGTAKDEEVIVLEDLKSQGYRSLENFPPMDALHCEAVMRSMAKLHASSLLLEESCRKKHSGNFDPQTDLYPEIREQWLIDKKGQGPDSVRQSVENMSTAAFKLWPDKFKGLSREKVVETLMEGWYKVFELAKPSTEYPNVICHGDPWTNNILFKYERTEDGKEAPVDAMFVDLQVARYATPIMDVITFLHTCTRRDFREPRLKDFLKVYHKTFGEYASEDTLRKFPFERMVQMCDQYRDVGLMMSTLYLPIVLSENDPVIVALRKSSESVNAENTIFIDRGDEIVNYCRHSESYRRWITDSFQECLTTLKIWD